MIFTALVLGLSEKQIPHEFDLAVTLNDSAILHSQLDNSMKAQAEDATEDCGTPITALMETGWH
jgi:hypothetical protein